MFKPFDIFLSINIDPVSTVLGDQGMNLFWMFTLPLPAAQIQLAAEDLFAHFLGKDHWIAPLTIHLGEHHLTALGTLFEGTDQIGNVLRVEQRLVGQGHDDRIEFV